MIVIVRLTPKVREIRYKAVVQLELGEEFPEDPKAQLWGAIGAASGLANRTLRLDSVVFTPSTQHSRLQGLQLLDEPASQDI